MSVLRCLGALAIVACAAHPTELDCPAGQIRWGYEERDSLGVVVADRSGCAEPAWADSMLAACLAGRCVVGNP